MNPTPHVIHYAPGLRLSAGGVVRAVLDWCGGLASRGTRVTLVTFDSPDVPGVVWLPPGRSLNGPVSAAAVRRWTATLTPEAVAHLHAPWPLSNVQMARAAGRAGVPYVVSSHGMLDDWSMAQRTRKKRLFLLAGGRRPTAAATGGAAALHRRRRGRPGPPVGRPEGSGACPAVPGRPVGLPRGAEPGLGPPHVRPAGRPDDLVPEPAPPEEGDRPAD